MLTKETNQFLNQLEEYWAEKSPKSMEKPVYLCSYDHLPITRYKKWAERIFTGHCANTLQRRSVRKKEQRTHMLREPASPPAKSACALNTDLATHNDQRKRGQSLKACVLSHFSRVQLMWPHGRYPPGSSVHGILQARILERVAMPSSRGSSWPRDWTWVSYVSFTGRQILDLIIVREKIVNGP